ncbi:MAG: amidohydrolase family protein [Planctomycetota bacterium]
MFALPLALVAPLALALTPTALGAERSAAREPAQGAGSDVAVAFVGARLIPIAGGEIENGVLVVRDGVILHVGALEVTPIPVGAEVRDVTGRVILPGLVDTHSHLGGVSGGDSSSPLQPEARALDSINARAPGFARARAGGLTTINVMPGSGHLCSGQTAYLKLRDGTTVEELAIEGPDGAPMGGLKMANGTNPRRDPPFPGTRAKSAALVRAMLQEAREYAAKIERAGDDADKRPDRDLGLEALVEVLEGKRIVHHHTHRHDDILTVLRLAEEFGFRVVLHHASEAWKVADEIAAAGVPTSLIVVDSPGGKQEALEVRFDTGAVLEAVGARTAFHTDDLITDSRLFLRSAALAVRAGMSRRMALEGLTLAGAEMLDLQERVGSLEVGKDADFVVLDGDPLSVYTKVLETWVEGQQVFDRGDPGDRLFAVGGYGAGDDRVNGGCCAPEVAR